jgi:predicted DNA-binding transcriptional regulator AlpA
MTAHLFALERAHMGTKKTRKPLPVVKPLAIVTPFSALDRVVSERQAAEILGFSYFTLRREVQAGRGPARVRLSEYRVGYRLSELYKYLEKNTEPSGGLVRNHHGPPAPSLA